MAAGIAFDREEHEPGIICIAAPILTARGRVLGALSITSATPRKTLDDLATLNRRWFGRLERCSDAATAWQLSGMT